MYSVYMHVNKANGKRYIGITSQIPPCRWKGGLGYKKQKRFFSAIVSYGWENFDHLILFDGLSKAEAEQKEFELIQLYRANDLRYGYNIENGGVIHKLSDGQKEHLRQIGIGKHHSQETKKKMSEAHKGQSRSWLIGRKASGETKAKMSIARSGAKNPRSKKVFQYALDGSFLKEYEYMDLIKPALNIKSTGHISSCCNGKRGQAHGFMWSYCQKKMEPYIRRRGGGVAHA